MKKEWDKIPQDGFFKVHFQRRDDLSPQQRVQLIRKGNECFNQGNVELAKKLFLTLHYSDGIDRVGDYYYNKGRPLEALEMYKIAPAPAKVERLITQMSQLIKQWIQDEEG